jgi:hypothetical protein
VSAKTIRNRTGSFIARSRRDELLAAVDSSRTNLQAAEKLGISTHVLIQTAIHAEIDLPGRQVSLHEFLTIHRDELINDLAILNQTELQVKWKSDTTLKLAVNELGIPIRDGREKRKIRVVPLAKLENEIIKPGIEDKLIPLLHFRGAVNLGRYHRYWNFAISMMLHECESLSEGVRISNNPDHSHLCMPPIKVGHEGLLSFFSRLQLRPDVTNNVPGLLEYAEYVSPRVLQLTPVSELRSRRNRGAWWRTFKEPDPKIRKIRDYQPKASDLVYPFLIHEPRQEHELLNLVNGAVPKSLPEQVRADICQDLIVAILSGEMEKIELQGNVKEYTRKVFKMFPTKYGPLSLDAPPPWADDGRTLAEVLA